MTAASHPFESSDQSDPSVPRHPACLQDGKAIGSNSCPCPLPCADRDVIEKLKS